MTRNERRRAAKAKFEAAMVMVDNHEQAAKAAKEARQEAILAVNRWTKPGTRTFCDPGLLKVC